MPDAGVRRRLFGKREVHPGRIAHCSRDRFAIDWTSLDKSHVAPRQPFRGNYANRFVSLSVRNPALRRSLFTALPSSSRESGCESLCS